MSVHPIYKSNANVSNETNSHLLYSYSTSLLLYWASSIPTLNTSLSEQEGCILKATGRPLWTRRILSAVIYSSELEVCVTNCLANNLHWDRDSWWPVIRKGESNTSEWYHPEPWLRILELAYSREQRQPPHYWLSPQTVSYIFCRGEWKSNDKYLSHT